MKTIMVPTDFSDTAKNAALYAIRFAEQMNSNKIILYNAYQPPPVTDVNLVVIDNINIADLEKNSKVNLEKFREELASISDKNIEFVTISDYAVITVDINEVCEENDVDLLVMGVTGGGKLEETLIGSFAVDVSLKSEVPVIIVPPGATFTEIKEVMLAYNSTKLTETIPVEIIKQLLDKTYAKLFVVNIDRNTKHTNADKLSESNILDTLLSSYNPQYELIEDDDFVEGINRVALEKEVDLIITIPKKMGWFDGLFKRSHTKMLAFHSHVPLMVVHQ